MPEEVDQLKLGRVLKQLIYAAIRKQTAAALTSSLRLLLLPRQSWLSFKGGGTLRRIGSQTSEAKVQALWMRSALLCKKYLKVFHIFAKHILQKQVRCIRKVIRDQHNPPNDLKACYLIILVPQSTQLPSKHNLLFRCQEKKRSKKVKTMTRKRRKRGKR